MRGRLSRSAARAQGNRLLASALTCASSGSGCGDRGTRAVARAGAAPCGHGSAALRAAPALDRGGRPRPVERPARSDAGRRAHRAGASCGAASAGRSGCATSSSCGTSGACSSTGSTSCLSRTSRSIARRCAGTRWGPEGARRRYVSEWLRANAAFRRYILAELRRRGPLRARESGGRSVRLLEDRRMERPDGDERRPQPGAVLGQALVPRRG